MSSSYDQEVGYDLLDSYKRRALKAGESTLKNLEEVGWRILPESRGESVAVAIDPNGLAHGFLVEGLGTKNIVAEQMAEIADQIPGAEREMFFNLAICNVGVVVNDMATWGIQPIMYGQHLALWNSKWLKNEERIEGFAEGTAHACNIVRCAWPCGETSALRDMVHFGTAVLGGGAHGSCAQSQLITCRLQAGHRIILVGSSGLHANGYTDARPVARELPDGYQTLMIDSKSVDSGMSYGKALLQPTILYGPLIAALQKNGVQISYAAAITGHGFRKLMRARPTFEYHINALPPVPEVFDFMQPYLSKIRMEKEKKDYTDRDMYSTFNMGAGMALFMAEDQVQRTFEVGRSLRYYCMDAGEVRESDRKRVVLPIEDGVFEEEELNIR